jgi:hypothetical protein
MPEKHKQYMEWNAERFVHWAQQVGPYTSSVIQAILTGHRVEQQGYKACMGILVVNRALACPGRREP